MFVIKETEALYNTARCTLSARVATAVTTYVVERRIRHAEEIKETMKEENGEERNRYSDEGKLFRCTKGNHIESQQKRRQRLLCSKCDIYAF